jgi:hypothetical protein
MKKRIPQQIQNQNLIYFKAYWPNHFKKKNLMQVYLSSHKTSLSKVFKYQDILYKRPDVKGKILIFVICLKFAQATKIKMTNRNLKENKQGQKILRNPVGFIE